MWRLDSCIPPPMMRTERPQRRGMWVWISKCLILFPICVTVSMSQWSSQIRWWLSPGSHDHDHGLWSLRSSWHPPDPDIDDMSCHPRQPVCTLSINSLLLTPVHTECLLFTLLYYTRNLFTRYLFSPAFVHWPIRSQCWLSLTNAGIDVIVTLHNIGSHSHIPRLVTINPSVNSLLAPVSFISNFSS